MSSQPEPFDLVAEAAVISTLMLDPDRIDEVRGIIKSDEMYSDANRRVLESIYALHDSGDPVDIVTIATKLKSTDRLGQVGGTPYLSSIMDETPSVAHVDAHARIVHDQWRARQAISGAQEMQQAFRENPGDAAKLQKDLTEAEAKFSEIAQSNGEPRLRPMRDLLKEAYDHIVAASKVSTQLVGCTTGYIAIDRATSGYEGGELTVIAGRPGMGKTAFEVESCVRSAKATGEAAAIFTLEMPARQLLIRILACEARIEMQKLRRATLNSAEWMSLTAAVQTLSTVPVFIDDSEALTVFDIRSRLRRLQAEIKSGKHAGVTKLGRASIDYLQLMQSVIASKRSSNREQEISDTTRRLKQLAKEMHIPVNILSQLNRAVEQRRDKRPELSDLRESGAIEQDADRVIFLYRDEYYDEESSDRGIAEAIIAKQRNGPTGTYKLKFTGEYTRFDDLAEGYFDDDGDFDEDENRDHFQDGLG